MIADASSPIGAPGVQRSATIAKHLAQFGWLPTVCTADEIDGLPLDTKLCDELPPDNVVNPRSAGGGILAMRRSLRGFVNARAGEGLTAAASRFAKAVDWRLDSWQSAIPRPDECIALTQRSVDALTRQIRSERYDVIYSTNNPASNHWLALELKRRANLPWVADFRNEGTDNGRNQNSPAQYLAAHGPSEQEILETADVVIAASEQQRRAIANCVPAQRGKLIALTNGFDPSDIAGVGDAGPLCGSEGLEVYNPIELTRQLASVLDRLADQAAEAVDESLTTCRP